MKTPPDPKFDAFAERLRAHPPASPPLHWRAEILAAAQQATVLSTGRPRALEALVSWLWPSPLAYAGLLAVWLLTLALWSTTPRPITPVATHQTLPLPDGSNYVLALSRERTSLHAMLFDPSHREEGRP